MADITFYGQFRDIAGSDIQLELPEDVTSLQKLQSHLAAVYPGFGDMLAQPRTKIVLNDMIMHGDMAISNTDRIEFLPPFSGG